MIFVSYVFDIWYSISYMLSYGNVTIAPFKEEENEPFSLKEYSLLCCTSYVFKHGSILINDIGS